MAVLSRMSNQFGTILIYIFSFTAALSFNKMLNLMFKRIYGNNNPILGRILYTIITITLAAAIAAALTNEEHFRYQLEKKLRRQ